jgi:predicted enzyme related to lactoylglutathione lyase
MGQPVVHFEIGCRDSERTQSFFKQLFGWKIKVEGANAMIETGGEGGIGGHITSLGHEPHRYVTVYVQVDDVEAYLKRAEILGGRRTLGPVDVPNGILAWFTDPDGNLLGLWKPKS